MTRLAPIVRLVVLGSALALAACGRNPTAPDGARHATPPTTATPDLINPHV